MQAPIRHDQYIPSNPQLQAQIVIQSLPSPSAEPAGSVHNVERPGETVREAIRDIRGPAQRIREYSEYVQDTGEAQVENEAREDAAPLPVSGNAANDNIDTDDNADINEHTPEELRVIADLRTRDQEVRAHEQAHMAAGGGYTGGVSYQFETGPDNRQYAVGGEVSIDASPISNDPEATIAKMQVVRGAALAPANPSGQDRAVAAAASQHEASAYIDLRELKAEEAREMANEAEEARQSSQQQSRISTDAVRAYSNPYGTLMFQTVVDLAG
jgi:hypothetical protein